MNFKQKTMFKNAGGDIAQLSAHQKLRKSKAYGLVAGVALAGTLAVAPVSVSADETTNSTPDTTAVTSDTTAVSDTGAVAVDTETPATGVEVTESTITNDTDTGLSATNLEDAAGTQTADGQSFENNANSTVGTTPITVDETDLLNSATDAQNSGVNVVQDKTSAAPTTSTASQTSEALASISADDKAKASELNSTAHAYSTAVSEWTDTKNSIVAFNADLDKAHLKAVQAYNDFIANLNADTAEVLAKYKDAIIRTGEKVQTSTNGKTIEGYTKYIQDLAAQEKLNDESIKAYLVEKEKYEIASTANSVAISTNVSLSQSVENQNNANSTSVANYNTSESQRVTNTNASLSTSAKAVENENSQAIASTEAKNKAASESVQQANATASASAEAENKRRSESASVANAQNSTTIAQANEKNASLSQSVVEHNNSLSVSADAENKRRSESASTANANGNQAVADIEAKNASLSQSVVEHNKSLSISASQENVRRSESAKNASYSTAASTTITNKDEADTYNKSVMQEAGLTWTGDSATDSTAVSEYNADAGRRTVISYDTAEVDAFNRDWSAQTTTLPNAGDGYTPEISDTGLGSRVVNGVKIYTTGGLGNPTAHIYDESGNLDASHIVNLVAWDGRIEAVDGGSITEGSIWDGTYPYTGYDRLVTIDTRKWYKLPDAVTLLDGSRRDAYIMYDIDSSGLQNDNSKVVIWNQNDSISAQDGYTNLGDAMPADGIRLILAVGAPDSNGENYLFTTVIADIDLGQYVEDAGTVLEVGGHMDATNGTASKENNDNVDGFNSLPKNAIVVAQYDKTYTNVIRNTAGGNGNATVRADFGKGGNITQTALKRKTTVKPEISLKAYTTKTTDGVVHNETYTPVTYTPVEYKPETVPDTPNHTYEKVTYTPVTYTPNEIPNTENHTYEKVGYTPATYTPETPKLKDTSWTPVTPNYKEYKAIPYVPVEVPEVPKEPVLNLTELTAPTDPEFIDIPKEPDVPTVHYHLTTLDTKQQVIKSVENEDGVNINNQSVSKGSTNQFTLNPLSFSANRQTVTSAVASDNMQEGLEIDLQAIIDANKGYIVDYDTTTRLLQFTATNDTLSGINADKSKAYDVVSPVVIFRTLNDAATYTNTFRWDINGGATGNVNVEYYIEGTTTLLGKAVDEVNEPVGNSYDTTDHKPKTFTKGGITYELVPEHVVGNETGSVIKGTTTVQYFYKAVEQVEKTGDVIVHYVDEDGNTIKDDVNDVTDGGIGDGYDTKDNKPTEITSGGVTYNIVPSKTVGEEVGDVKEGVTEVTYVYKRVTPTPKKGNGYTVFSNKVTIHTPGGKDNPNDPDNPNGGGNEKIQPVKNNTDAEGKNINDKQMLQNSVNHYVAEWDLDQYVNDKSSKSAIAKGFAYIDDFQDDALTPNEADFTIVTGKGEEVKGLTYTYVESLETATEAIKQLVANSGVSPKGAFLIWVADDAQAFYDTYVKTGTDVYFNLPMTVTKGFTGNYVNQTYQIDFGNGYTSNIVKNDVPDLVPHKDVVVDGSSVDGGTIAYGQQFKYQLSGVVLPADRGTNIWQYDYKDDYDQTGDKFLETYTAVSTTETVHKVTLELAEDATYDKDVTYTDDVTLEDGTILKAGTVIKAGTKIPKGTKISYFETIHVGDDLTKYTTMEHDVENGIIYIRFTEDFLNSIEDSSPFGADVFIDMERIAYGTFENTYVNIVNGVEYLSNTVRTTTPAPEPEVPTTPVPTPDVPVEPASVLPTTGEKDNGGLAVIGALGILGTIALAGTSKRKKEEN